MPSHRILASLLAATILTGEALAGDRSLLAQINPEAPLAEVARPQGEAGSGGKAVSKQVKPKRGMLTLDEAIRKAIATSPRLKASQASVAASRGEQRQAGALQNPELSYSKENFRAGSAYKVISPAQNVYGVSQLVEVGGKVSARKKIATQGLQIAGLESQATALDLIRDVTIAYAEAVAAEESVALAAEQKSLAEDVLASVSARVDAAASPLMQKSRAEVERSAAIVALDGAKRDRAISRKTLATLVGEDEAKLALDKKPFFVATKPKSTAASASLEKNPDVAKQGSLMEQSRARLDLEKANAVPDPRLSAGLIEIPSAKDKAFLVGVSLPIPVLNANRGNIERARGEMARTEQEARYTALALDADLTRAGQQMENAYFQASTLKGQILPAAQKAFSLAREGYGLGRLPYLEVLDAQRSLFDAKAQQIAALRAYHTARAVVERLTAAHADDFTPQDQLNAGNPHAE